MPLLPLDTGLKQYQKLEQAIDAYNAISNDYPVQKIYQLQLINYLLERAVPSPALDDWLNHTEESGWEHQLQKVGVHRDASAFLKSIEFARAVHLISPQTRSLSIKPENFQSLLVERNELLTDLTSIEAFEEVSHRLFYLYQSDEKIKTRTLEHQHFLALSYAKAEAIKNLVQQSFSEYDTHELSQINNANFFLDIAGEPYPLVIRVEARNDQTGEADLQTKAVSEYFSEDYITFMLRFKDELGDIEYRPVVISQFASNGDLEHFSEGLTYHSTHEKGKIAQDCFLQISDFLIQLEAAGYYHPDIKLANFLYDKGRVLCADRKSLIDSELAFISNIKTTPKYAPPEFLENVYLNWDKGIIIPKKRTIKLDMSSFMSYQVGEAITEYLEKSNALHDRPLSNTIQNLMTLQRELSRENPADRLRLVNLHLLLGHLEKAPGTFLAELEMLHPRKNLSFEGQVEMLNMLLRQNNDTDEYVQQLQGCAKKLPKNISEDTRFRDLHDALERKVKDIESELHAKDKALATGTEKILDRLGLRRVPQRTVDDTRQKILTTLQNLLNPYKIKEIEVKKTSVISSETVVKPAYGPEMSAEDEAREETFSGTFIRVPIQESDKEKSSIPNFDFDEETELEVYSPPTQSHDSTPLHTPPKPITQEENIQKQKELVEKLRALKTPQSYEDEESDIDTTIQRGDKDKKTGPKTTP